MKYWNGDQIMERDVVEGESFFDTNNPYPAYKGLKLLSDGEKIMYEIEIVPGSDRIEPMINPNIYYQSSLCIEVDMLHRQWDNTTNQWVEMTIPYPLELWGYDAIPNQNHLQQLSNFDRAMRGI